jgi:hypothetical protein
VRLNLKSCAVNRAFILGISLQNDRATVIDVADANPLVPKNFAKKNGRQRATYCNPCC